MCLRLLYGPDPEVALITSVHVALAWPELSSYQPEPQSFSGACENE